MILIMQENFENMYYMVAYLIITLTEGKSNDKHSFMVTYL